MSRQVFLSSPRNTEITQWRRQENTCLALPAVVAPEYSDWWRDCAAQRDFKELRDHYKYLSDEALGGLFTEILANANQFYAAHLLELLAKTGKIPLELTQAVLDAWSTTACKEAKKAYLSAVITMLDQFSYYQRLEIILSAYLLAHVLEDFLLPEYLYLLTIVLRVDKEFIISAALLGRIGQLFDQADPDEQQYTVRFLRAQLGRCCYDPYIAFDDIVGVFYIGRQLNLLVVEEQITYMLQMMQVCYIDVKYQLWEHLDYFCHRALCSSLLKKAARLVVRFCERHILLAQSYGHCVRIISTVRDDYSMFELLYCCLIISKNFYDYCQPLLLYLEQTDYSIEVLQNYEARAILRYICENMLAGGLRIENSDLLKLCE